MATTNFSSALQITNSTDALFRAWAQFVDDTLINGGWVNTSDTGQLTISTATHPSVANALVGYRIYHMADTLQATAPVFMKIIYGSGGAANSPSMNITFGTGTDGSGNITGSLGANPIPATSTNGTNGCNSYASASTNRLSLLLFVRSGGTDLLIFSVERTKDSTGADTADGLLISWGNSGALNFTSYVSTTPGTQPPSELGIATVLSNVSGTTAFGGNAGVGVPLHFKGTVQQPGMGIIIVNSGDFPAQSSVVMSMYSATHTFQLGDSVSSQVTIQTGNTGTSSRPNTRVGIRYE